MECTSVKLILVDEGNANDGGHDFSEASNFPLIGLSEPDNLLCALIEEDPAGGR